MKRLLSLPLFLIATATFAEPAQVDTAAIDAMITASLEAKVAAKLDNLNNVGFGVVTIVDVTGDSAAHYNGSFDGLRAGKVSPSANPLL